MKKKKHNYTNEIELKSLLIRFKNFRQNLGTLKDNSRVNELVRTYVRLQNKKCDDTKKKERVKTKLFNRIIDVSETLQIDKISYDRFGYIIILMIKNILTKPQFNGYTYSDDFFSDASYKILRYIENFDHRLISKISGTYVSAFSYISQIIHNSIIFIIQTHKRHTDNIDFLTKRQKIIYEMNKSPLTVDSYYKDVEPEPLKIVKNFNSMENFINDFKVYINSLKERDVSELIIRYNSKLNEIIDVLALKAEAKKVLFRTSITYEVF